MSVPDNYQIIQTTSTQAQIRVDIDWDYDSITDLYIWQQDIDTGVITYFNLGDFAVVEKSDGSGDYIEVENVSTVTALVNTARRSPLTQTYDLLNSEALDPVALIEALDKSIKILQEQDAITGTPNNQAITSVNPFTIPDKVARANGFLGFDENGDPIIDASDSALLAWAREWAINPEDSLISAGAGGNGVDDYSSLHHANKSSASASEALASENKANLWAEEDEDVEVETGEYSAFHWSKKAEAISQEISNKLVATTWNMVEQGCDPTGVVDSSAVIDALVAGSFASGDTMYFPKGTYRLDTFVQINNKGFRIKGDGINSTSFLITNSTGGITAVTSDDTNPEYVDFRDFTITTTTNTDWAIKVNGTGNVLDERNSPRINIKDIEINCETVNTSFSKAIFLDNTMHATISRVHGKAYWTGTSASITSGDMIRISGVSSPVEFHISDCWSFFFDVAVHALDKIEGLLIDKLQAIAVNRGVVWNTSEPKPQLTVTSSHINSYSRAIQLVNLAQGNIQGNLLYKRTESEANWKGVDCNTVRDTTILNNVFGDTSNTGLGTANAIELTTSTNNNISLNRMFNLDKGVFTDATSLDNTVTFNDSIGTTTDLDLLEVNATSVSNKLGSTVFKGYLSDEDTDVLKFRPLNGVNMGLEIGSTELGGIKYIDFITENGTDYNARIEVAGGSTTQGSGDMTFDANSYTFLNAGIDASGPYNNTSDKRLKEGVEPIAYSLTDLLKLEPKQYRMVEVKSDDGKFISRATEDHTLGLIAQEVEDVIPECVSENKDGYKQMAYSLLIPVMIQAIKDLNDKVEEYNNRKTDLYNEKFGL